MHQASATSGSLMATGLSGLEAEALSLDQPGCFLPPPPGDVVDPREPLFVSLRNHCEIYVVDRKVASVTLTMEARPPSG